MKKVMTIMALLCAVVLQVVAEDQLKEALKEVERAVPLADKNPNNGRMQFDAAVALANTKLGDKMDFDRAEKYGLRAVELAEQNPEAPDTLLPFSYQTMAMIYQGKNDIRNTLIYSQKTVEAYEKKLGKEDPMTNSSKIVFAGFLASFNPFNALHGINEAFQYDSMAPEDKRLENIQEANILREFLFEYLIAEYTRFYRYSVPYVYYEGRRQMILQTPDWNIERPLVGWMQQNFLRTEKEKETYKGDDIVLCDHDGVITIIPFAERSKLYLQFTFGYAEKVSRKLATGEHDARLWNLSLEGYNQMLEMYRKYKEQK